MIMRRSPWYGFAVLACIVVAVDVAILTGLAIADAFGP